MMDEYEEGGLVDQSHVRLEFLTKQNRMGSSGGEEDDEDFQCMVDEEEGQSALYIANNNGVANANNYITTGTGSRPNPKVGAIFPKASSIKSSVIPKSITKNLTVSSFHKKNQESIQGAHNLIYKQSRVLRDTIQQKQDKNEGLIEQIDGKQHTITYLMWDYKQG